MRSTVPADEGGHLHEVQRLATLGRALADPARVRILSLLAQGRACCATAGKEVPAQPGDEGVCVCELEAALGLRQSLVSYHLGLLKQAGLVREERRGRWSFYSLDRAALGALAASLAALAGGDARGGVAAAPPDPGPAAGGREVSGMAFAGKRDETARRGPQGGFVPPAADAGCCGETACCGDGDGQADACCSGCC